MEHNKASQLILISGLINIHRWGKEFLQTLVQIWGSENIYIIYTNKDTRVKRHHVDGKTIYSIGRNNYRSGANSIHAQAKTVAKKVQILQANYGLKPHFHIIGHSMGGLVARRYIYDNPNTVANLVTLGTPHHGSPLANFYKWLSYFIGARKAFANLTPQWLKTFNQRYPIHGAPLYNNGKVYTIRGYISNHPIKNFGVIGELLFAWLTMRFIYKQKSDGLVPENSVLAEGAEHLADFPKYHHLDLVRRRDVAEKASMALLR